MVPGIFSIGAIAGIDVGYELSATADVSFTIGLNAQIPNAAYVRADLANLGKSGAGKIIHQSEIQLGRSRCD